MKKINIILASLFIASLTVGCNDEDEAEVFQNRDIPGIAIDVTGSGEIISEQDGEELTITSANLNMEVSAGNIEDSTIVVSKFEVVKQFEGGPEVSVGTFESLPITVDLTGINQFLEGTSITEQDLSLENEFTFTVKQHQADGDVYSYANNGFSVAVE